MDLDIINKREARYFQASGNYITHDWTTNGSKKKWKKEIKTYLKTNEHGNTTHHMRYARTVLTRMFTALNTYFKKIAR